MFAPCRDDALISSFFLPASMMFWFSAGLGGRLTIDKSWMDGSGRSPLTVVTAQAAHSLSLDVAARRLYWISDYKKVSSGVEDLLHAPGASDLQIPDKLKCFDSSGDGRRIQKICG